MRNPVTNKLLVFGFVAAFSLGIGACGAGSRPKPMEPSATFTVATPVSDDQFAQAVMELIGDGGTSSNRLALLAGVVRRQFARASERFEAGQSERGLDAVKGALFLVRAGEMHLEMLDPASAKALKGAHETVAPRGSEGPSLAFLQLQSRALPKDHPEQKQIQEHLQALEAWMKDTRQRSDVENTSADARTYGERAMLEPSAETLQQAQAMTERWLEASMQFNASFRPSLQNSSRDEMLEAYRALRTGAIVLAGLYLRHGDAAGAAKALERSEARKITSPELFERLQSAASGDDPTAWSDLASLYSRASSEADEEELTMPQEIAQGATWGAALAAYRVEPSQLATAGPMALLLATYGMPETAPLVFVPVVKAAPHPETVSIALRVVAGIMIREDEARDDASVRRVFDASQGLLNLADSVHAKNQLDPSPSRIRAMMASLHQRSGNLEQARPMLLQTLQQEPSLTGYLSLSAMLLQAGDKQGALKAANDALRAPDAQNYPVGRAEAHLQVFLVNRAHGKEQEAKVALASALKDAITARSVANTDLEYAFADRVLARLAFYFGDRQAWQRAVERLLARANLDSRVLSLALIEATSTGLLNGDLKTSQRAFEETAGAADPEDRVYAALWLQLAQRLNDGRTSTSIEEVLSTTEKSNGWTYHLARWGLEEISDDALQSKARSVVERAEAHFYIVMRKRVGGSQIDGDLASLAAGPAIDLVETHLARELTQSKPAGYWGPAPLPFP